MESFNALKQIFLLIGNSYGYSNDNMSVVLDHGN